MGNMKYKFLVTTSIILMCMSSYAQAVGPRAKIKRDYSEASAGYHAGKKWVAGIAGVALLASAAAEHSYQARKGRAAIITIAIPAFAIAAYSDSRKGRKLSVSVDKKGNPIMALSMRF